MANLLAITKTYQDGDVLLAADLNHFKTDPETFLNDTKLNNDNIQDAGITGSTKLAQASVTTAKLATDAVTTAKIQDGSVTTAKILNNAVTTAKINDFSITRALRELIATVASTYSNSSTGTTETTLGSVDITTTGRPIMIGTNHDALSVDTFISAQTSTLTTIEHDLNLRIYRGATLVHESHMRFYDDLPDGTNRTFSFYVPAGAVWVIDTPTAGTYTYTLKYQNDVSGKTKAAVASLYAVEL